MSYDAPTNEFRLRKILSDEETLAEILKEENLTITEAKEVLALSRNTIKSEPGGGVQTMIEDWKWAKRRQKWREGLNLKNK